MTFRRAFAALIAASLLGLACGGVTVEEDEPAPVDATSEALVSLRRAWTPDDYGIVHIPVCFYANYPQYAQEKSWIRNSLETQWGTITSLRFEGFDDCRFSHVNPSDSEIRIAFEDVADPNPDGGAPIGREPWSRIGPSTLPMRLNVTFQNWHQECADETVDDYPGNDREFCVRSVALHEVGHALGFTNEQEHPQNQGRCTTGVTAPQPNSVALTDYDPKSIMNDCGRWRTTELSELDRKGAEVLYGVAPFVFSSAGLPLNYDNCISVNEPSDPHSWSDNYFCTATSTPMKWSNSGPIAGMRCTQITEPSDPNTWNDNYLCVPNSSPVQFTWSSTGTIGGQQCVQWREPSDPNGWNDDYLCYTMDYALSPRGPIAGMECGRVGIGKAYYPWADNYFCSKAGSEPAWLSSGPYPSAQCNQIIEPSDPTWPTDSYLCSRDAARKFMWSYAGDVPGKTCVPWNEPDAPSVWNDNALCYCSSESASLCGSTCVELATDRNNCGSCGRVCAGSQKCVSGACVTPCFSNQTICSCTGQCATAAACARTCGR